MNWEGPGILLRIRPENPVLKIEVHISPVLLKICQQKDSYDLSKNDKHGTVTGNRTCSSSQIVLEKDIQSISQEIVQGKFLQDILQENKIGVVFIEWEESVPHELLFNTMCLMDEYAERYKNILFILSLKVSDIRLLQAFMKQKLKNIFVTFGYIKINDTLQSPSSYLLKLFEKEIKQQFFQYSLANKVLLEDGYSEINSYKDYLYCVSRKINPIIRMGQRQIRLMGDYMCDGATTFTQRIIMLGLRKIIFQIAKKYIYQPNNHSLRKRIERELEYILRQMWNVGIFRGEKTEEAYYIHCRSELESSVHASNYLNITVGVALNKPAQFFEIEISRILEVIE
ncbi:MAG: hypothetical protein Kow00108_13770 [Calditrichia bacterium]